MSVVESDTRPPQAFLRGWDDTVRDTWAYSIGRRSERIRPMQRAIRRTAMPRATTGSAGAVGQRSFSGHCRHRGSAPCRSHDPIGSAPRATASAARPAPARGGAGPPSRRLAFAGMSPRRLETRCTCVSTGIASLPSANDSTTAAVFGPTPGSDVRYARASPSETSRRRERSKRPSRSSTARRIDWIRGAFVSARPPERIASATAACGRRHHLRPGGVDAARSCANARSAFRSLVCCDRTVRISSSSGSTRRGGARTPHRFSSRARMARTRRGVAVAGDAVTGVRRVPRCGTA